MARPRIFVSSTYYDLKYLRADLENFIRSLGYEPVLHERGHVPYGKESQLESYCYREIQNVDILVSVIGGRFGSPSKESAQREAAHKQVALSVSQMEFKVAHKLKKQVYVFVEQSVYAELATFRLNRENATVKYASVNDVRIFEFLQELEAAPSNIVIVAFDDTAKIVAFLREQWAGLFQRFLSEERQNLASVPKTESEAELLEAQAMLQKHQQLLEQHGDRHFAANRLKLSRQRTAGVVLRNAGQHLDPTALEDWIGQTLQWADAVEKAIAEVDPADAEWFRTLDAVPPARVQHVPVNRDHTKAFNEHDYRVFRLGVLIERYAEGVYRSK